MKRRKYFSQVHLKMYLRQEFIVKNHAGESSFKAIGRFTELPGV